MLSILKCIAQGLFEAYVQNFTFFEIISIFLLFCIFTFI